MSFATRTILILMLTLPLAGPVAAQESTSGAAASTTAAEEGTTPATDTATGATTSTPATDTAAAGATAAELPSSYEVRNEFTRLLQRHPDDVITVLVLEPTLLANETYLASYPSLAQFVAEHPEVARQPRFYLREFAGRARTSGPGDVLEPLMAFAGFLLLTFALGWFIRTWIEQRRWTRLSRRQTEVHTKILDRFGTSAELLEYIKTPAGTKFLESAPIPLHSEPVRQNTPLTRVLWTIQLGVIMAAAGVGMLLVSLRYSDGDGQGLFALGAIALCIGAGFIGSAAVSLVLSRRLKMWEQSDAPPPFRADHADVS